MEQHPVPRNISSFQFHLIGDMTIRQFGYLAAGAFIGYLIYKAAPFPAIINITLALTFGFIGFAFAFLPIQERPLDKWLASFIKSILSPTQYIWRKNNLPPEILTRSVAIHIQVSAPSSQITAHKETNEKLRAYLATIPIPLHESLNAAEKRYIDKTMALFQTGPVVGAPASPIPTNIPKPTPVKLTITPQVEEKPITPTPEPAFMPISKIEDHTVLRDQLSQLAAEKVALEKQLQKLQQQLSGVNHSQIINPVISQQVQSEPTIKVVNPKSAGSDIGMMNYDQAPNLISGAIKDPQRKMLPNIILTIKDKSGMPVRALKTNKLGQFTTASPLPNGTYLLEVEDPMKRYAFDIAQIALSGKVFLPIEIIAKGEKELMRAKLAKELFGSTTM